MQPEIAASNLEPSTIPNVPLIQTHQIPGEERRGLQQIFGRATGLQQASRAVELQFKKDVYRSGGRLRSVALRQLDRLECQRAFQVDDCDCVTVVKLVHLLDLSG